MAEGQFESSRAKYSNFDRERFAAEAHSSKRSDFSRDRARILHSSALRRLSAKTQVLSPTAGVDNARNRLTHSLEVAQVGRELASSLGLDPDVVDAACLAHDLGHPPFGHNGERALNDWCSDIGGFEGNAQTFRLLTRLESKVFDSNGRSVGLNLTRASLSASCKYPWPASSAIGDPSGRAKFGVYSEDLEIFNWMQSGSSRSSACIEAQVMDLSDDIAYSVHDFEDAIQSGYIDVPALGARVDHQDLVDSMFEWIGGEHSRDELIQAFDRLDSLEYWIDGYDGTRQANSRLKNLTSQLIGRFVGAAIQQTLETNSGSGASIRDSEISVPIAIRAEIAVLKGIVAANVMSTNSRKPIYAMQRSVLKELADAYLASAPDYLEFQFVEDWQNASTDQARKRVIADQVSSLTDQSAFARHKQFEEPKRSKSREPRI